LHKDLRLADRIGGVGIAPRVDCNNNGLRAKAAANRVNKLWAFQSGGVHAHLVRACLKDLRRIVRGTNAAANTEGHEEFARRSAHRVQQRLPPLMRRGNIEQHNLVRAFAGMTRRLRRRIARIDQIDELHTLYNAPVMHVEAGDDAFGNHSASFHVRKLPRIFSPVAPDFSG